EAEGGQRKKQQRHERENPPERQRRRPHEALILVETLVEFFGKRLPAPRHALLPGGLWWRLGAGRMIGLFARGRSRRERLRRAGLRRCEFAALQSFGRLSGRLEAAREDRQPGGKRHRPGQPLTEKALAWLDSLAHLLHNGVERLFRLLWIGSVWRVRPHLSLYSFPCASAALSRRDSARCVPETALAAFSSPDKRFPLLAEGKANTG